MIPIKNPHSRTFSGVEIMSVLSMLVKRGCVFHVEPLPDDHWEVSVKPDAADFLKKLNSVEEIELTWVCSTQHISEAMDESLTAREWEGEFVVYDINYGWIIHVREDCEIAETYPPELIPLVTEAQERGCCYLKLDRDGPVYSWHKTYEW